MTPDFPTAAAWRWLRWVRSQDPEVACGLLADATPAQKVAIRVFDLVNTSHGKPAAPPCPWWAPPNLLAIPLPPEPSPPCPADEQRGAIGAWRRIGWCPSEEWWPQERLAIAYRVFFDAEPQRDHNGGLMLTARELRACLDWCGLLERPEVRR